MTNFEVIKAMTVEEMAEFLHEIVDGLEECSCCPADDFCDENTTRLGCTVRMFIEWLESERRSRV